ncbi:MAG: LytTR family DNA-binding domain-containing protein [Chromatiales bacterium]|jgi:two-component system response regulator AlgR
MNILIVDDELPARQRLTRLLQDIGNSDWRVAAEAENGQQAVDICTQQNIDAVLMDIRMPVMDGLQAATTLAQQDNPPAVIFITAYEEHALAAFDSNAVAYLLKPVRHNKLEQALQRLQQLNRAQLKVLQQLNEPTAYLSGSYRGGVRRIAIDEVICLLAEQKYVTACAAHEELLLDDSLKTLEQQLDERFVRIHRNALVAKDHIAALEKDAAGQAQVRLKNCERRLEVSRRHLPEVRKLLKS